VRVCGRTGRPRPFNPRVVGSIPTGPTGLTCTFVCSAAGRTACRARCGRSVVAGRRSGVLEGLMNQRPHRVRRSPRGVLGQVAVGIDRDPDRRMAQHLRHDRHRDASGKHQRRRTVPEVVQPDLPQAGGPGQGHEPAGDVLRPQRGAVLPGEDQVVVLVRVPSCLPVEFLPEPPLEQGLHRPLGQRNPGLRRPRLRGGELEKTTDVDDGLPDPRAPLGEVEV
jgi:hypothetical protein